LRDNIADLRRRENNMTEVRKIKVVGEDSLETYVDFLCTALNYEGFRDLLDLYTNEEDVKVKFEIKTTILETLTDIQVGYSKPRELQ